MDKKFAADTPPNPLKYGPVYKEKMMIVVGLTGGIGSGKTAATDCFKALGVTIVDADIASRVVVEPGRPALVSIAEHFGDHLLQADGSLDRAQLRSKIFSDPAAKTWLEALLHPLIAEEIQQGLARATSPYAIFVSPLLVESKQRDMCDRLLVIDVPEQLQVTRTTERDNNDAEQVQRIIASQASRQQRLQKATEVIENTGALTDLQQQVQSLHLQYLQLATDAIKVGE
ncbi:MAG: dephospho-CoA kinase [Paraglaciecola psychrophila]